MVIAAVDIYQKGNCKFFLSFFDLKLLLKNFSCSASALYLAKAACGSRVQLQTQTMN